jgi:hypothetical protein
MFIWENHVSCETALPLTSTTNTGLITVFICFRIVYWSCKQSHNNDKQCSNNDNNNGYDTIYYWIQGENVKVLFLDETFMVPKGFIIRENHVPCETAMSLSSTINTFRRRDHDIQRALSQYPNPSDGNPRSRLQSSNAILSRRSRRIRRSVQ